MRFPSSRLPGRHALGRRARPSLVCAVLLLVAAVLVAALPPPPAAVRLLPTVRAGEPPPPAVLRAAEGDGGPVWPLAGRPAVVRGWEPPAGPYAPGHRGVDLAARAGDTVVAAATGRVSFAGRVAGRGVLVIELAGSGAPPLRTTYEPVRALVAKGDEVVAGRPVGLLEAGPFHCAEGCLHWGLRRGEAYLNPLSLLRRGPSRLLPVFGVPEP
ncbi:murein hydrolase activator EnvC family protein [Streptomyces bacillaris]|uniref:murein hydrolase activator EnvC family protein n=1 Tax=Streptomyces TaxID=1883 RepID=UPI00116BE1C9|nr:peptidase M23-like protein [Streptomyces cavourensis]GGU85627.1 peptidase M23 [Streptomyces cavourensis]